MSGPKTAAPKLTPEQLKKLQEEIERRMKLAAARGKVNLRISKIRNVIDETDIVVARNINRAALSDKVMELQKLRNDAFNVIAAVSVASDTENISAIEAEAEKLKSVYESLAAAQSTLTVAAEELEGEIEEQKNATLANLRNVSFRNIGRKIEEKRNVALEKIIEALKGIDIQHLPAEFIKKISSLKSEASVIDSEDFAENFYSMSVKPFVKECVEYSAMYERYIEEYESLVAEYETLASSLSIPAEVIAFSEEAIANLKNRIAELKEIALKVNEEEYISQCIDEAMQEMGYNMVGDRVVTKKNGRKLRHELYLFDEGTAVDVTYANNGQISMELGGLDSEDRTPTNAEAKELADSMESFCDTYVELEKRLLKKGIVVKRISVLPPDEQYAQIINVEDYNMTEKVTNFEVKTSKKQSKEQTALRKEL